MNNKISSYWWGYKNWNALNMNKVLCLWNSFLDGKKKQLFFFFVNSWESWKANSVLRIVWEKFGFFFVESRNKNIHTVYENKRVGWSLQHFIGSQWRHFETKFNLIFFIFILYFCFCWFIFLWFVIIFDHRCWKKNYVDER